MLRKTLLAALIAASALAPVAANAQEQRDRGENVDREAFRTMRDQRRAERGAAPQGLRPDRQLFRQERREDRQDFRQERGDDRRDFQRDRQDDRQDFRVDRRGDRQEFRGGWNRNGYADRRNWNGRGGFGNEWNRGWRNDRRYDWRSVRTGNRYAYRLPRYYAPRGYGFGYQRFGIGVTMGSFLFAPSYWISDPFAYRLPPAYGPYHWVRYYNDALLVDVRTGQVIDVEHAIFW